MDLQVNPGRARLTALGQQALESRLPARAQPGTTIIHAAGSTEAVRARRVAMSRPAMATMAAMARQAVQDRSANIRLAGAMAIATSSIRRPPLPREAQALTPGLAGVAASKASSSGTGPGAAQRSVAASDKTPDRSGHIRSDREIKAMKALLAADAARSLRGPLKDFASVWAERHTAPVECEKFLEFAELDNTETARFLRALDDLRTAPSADKAAGMLRDFVQEAETDDVGIPLPGRGKWQLNFRDHETRRQAIATITQRLAEVRATPDSEEKLQALVDAFAAHEREFVNSLARNCKFHIEVNALKR